MLFIWWQAWEQGKSELCEEVNLRPFVFCSTTVLIPHRKLKFFYQSLGNKIKIFFLIQQHAGGGGGVCCLFPYSGLPLEWIFPCSLDRIVLKLFSRTWVTWRVDTPIHWINLYSLDSTLSFINAFLLDNDLYVDRVFCPLNNWAWSTPPWMLP